MDYALNEEQLMFQKAIRSLADKEIAPLVNDAEENEKFPVQLFPMLGKLGYLAVGYPARFGGAGMGKTGEVIFHEEVGRINTGIASTLSSQMCLSTSMIADYGSKEQQERYLVPALRGEKIAAFALTEPDAGSDAGSLKTLAVRDGDSYVINGSKIFTTGGPIADFLIVVAYTDRSKGTRGGMSCFIVDKETPGFTVRRQLRKLGMNSEETGEEAFDNCRVPAANVIGAEGKGFGYVLSSLNGTRITAAARDIGLAQVAYEAALDYAKTRTQFGQPLGKFQAISFRLAEMATRIRAARWMVYHAAWLYDRTENHQGRECSQAASMARLFSSETVIEVTSAAMHICGGYGLMKDLPLERYFRDARFSDVLVGTSDIQKMGIAWSIGL